MNTIRIKHSILAVGTQLIPVDLVMWGERKLTSEELSSLNEANTNVLNYLAANNISFTVIKEKINNQNVDVGIEAVFPNFSEFKNTDVCKAIDYWAERMRDDSDIRVFNWMEVIS